MNTLVVIDFSVAAHQLHANLVTNGVERTHYMGVVRAQMSWLMSLEWLGIHKPDPASTNIVLAMDTKIAGKYWRHDYLEQPAVFEKVWAANKSARSKKAAEPIFYKAGRKYPEKSFTKLKKDMEAIAVSQGWQLLKVAGYEADDIAAAFVAANRGLPTDQQVKIWTISIDSDWLGLVGEDCSWFCLYGWSPRVRADLKTINSWSARRLNKTFAEPKDLWAYKSEYGDKSDNLPKNSPIEVIDLLNPPDEHKLWAKPQLAGIFRKLLTEHQKTQLPEITKATEYLRLLGVPKFVKPYLDA